MIHPQSSVLNNRQKDYLSLIMRLHNSCSFRISFSNVVLLESRSWASHSSSGTISFFDRRFSNFRQQKTEFSSPDSRRNCVSGDDLSRLHLAALLFEKTFVISILLFFFFEYLIRDFMFEPLPEIKIAVFIILRLLGIYH